MCLISFSVTAADSPEGAVDDVRIIIDISGSMKQTDPENLRVPALRLFTHLLPEGTESGVWTFAQWVNMLVPHGLVDDKWKQQAATAGNKINSVGLFTNIEDALKRATWDWKEPDPLRRRSLILLTDGLVDVSANPEENQASRERILQEILPRLQSASATINTIALSQNSDINLLNQLAASTNGLFKTIEDTDNLERLFLKLFDQVTESDSLPLTDNNVVVDDSINEMTFLVFRKKADEAVSLLSPSGAVLNHSSDYQGMSWHTENRFDLITIKAPERGKWHIEAEVDPDNRVMVVTDLSLKNSKLPTTVLMGERLTYDAHLEAEGKIIDSQNFLHFTTFKLSQYLNKDSKKKYKLNDDGQSPDLESSDGIYTVYIDEITKPGEYEFSIEVNGTTFKRQNRQVVQIVESPAQISVDEASPEMLSVSIIPYPSLLDITNMSVEIVHVLPSGESFTSMAKKLSPAEWSDSLNTRKENGTHEIKARILTEDDQGNPLNYELDNKKIKVGSDPEPSIIEDEKEDHEVVIEEGNAQPVNWLMVILRVLTFNILLGIIAFGVIKAWAIFRNKIIPFPVMEMNNV